MQSAIDVIKDTYDYETCKEIVDHGCQSGVCHEHLRYADTIRFFDEYEGEITDFVVDSADAQFVGEVLSQHGGDLNAYKNDMTWAFIEFVAMDVVDNQYEQEREDDEVISEYLNDADDDEPIKLYAHYSDEEIKVLQAHGFNPQRSMNLNRYSHA
tara:strand:- start:3824 stop:4288 length:465 start_codon:yes stop_codon:yes gene_type:complete